MRADIRDVARHCSRTNGAQWLAPELVRRIAIKLPVQGVAGDDGRVATIRAGLLFVTNPGPYARQTGQAPSPVGADVAAETAQIIMQLAPFGRLLRNRLPGNGYP